MKQKLLLLIALMLSTMAIDAETVYAGFDNKQLPAGWTTDGTFQTDRFQQAAPCVQFTANKKLTTSALSKISSVDFYASRTSKGQDLNILYSIDGTNFINLESIVSADIITGMTMKKHSLNSNSLSTISSFENVTLRFTTSVNSIYIDDITIVYGVSASDPLITTTPATLNPFSTTTIEPTSQTIKVGAINLTDFLNLEISGADAGLFTVTPDLLMPEVDPLSPDFGKVADTDVVIAYTPTVVGSHTATLTLKSLGATDVTFALSGTAVLPTLATPVATEATAITEKSFTANWDAVPNTTEYELNVLKFDPNAKGDGTEGRPYSVSDRRDKTITGEKWIVGYIVGVVTGSSNSTPPSLTVNHNAPFTQNTNVALADSPTEIDGTRIIAVQLQNSTAIQTALNLKDNASNIGKVLKIKGTFENYFGTNPGVKTPSEYVLDAVIPGDEVVAGSPFTITDATSFEVTGLKHNTDYKYSVIAKGTEYLNSEPSNVITVKTADIIPTEVVSIADITDPNVYYQVNEPLEGVYQVGNVAYVKNEKGGNPNKTTRPEHYHGDLDADFEQSSWMKITAPDAQNYTGSTINEGIVGKLNAETGAFDVVTMPTHAPKTDHYVPFYKDKANKFNSFTLWNFNPQPDGYYYVAPQENEVAFISQVRFKIENNILYFTDGNYQIGVKQTVPIKADIIDKILKEPTAAYSAKVIFLKQPKATRAGETEWIIEHIDTDASVDNNVITGVSDIIVNGNDVKVIGTNGAIEVFAANASAINVYNLSGAIVRSINNADNYTSISVPAGAYIVKVQNTAVKVIVK